MKLGGMVQGLDESLRRRVETLIGKNQAKDSARDGFDVEYGSEVIYLRCSNEFMFFFRGDVGWGLMTE